MNNSMLKEEKPLTIQLKEPGPKRNYNLKLNNKAQKKQKSNKKLNHKLLIG